MNNNQTEGLEKGERGLSWLFGINDGQHLTHGTELIKSASS